MSIGNLILGASIVTVSYLIHYDSLLQNATDFIRKCDSYFITNCDRKLLQNASGFLLHNATVLLKMRQFLQITTIFLQNTIVITKCNLYYKLRLHKRNSKSQNFERKHHLDTTE